MAVSTEELRQWGRLAAPAWVLALGVALAWALGPGGGPRLPEARVAAWALENAPEGPPAAVCGRPGPPARLPADPFLRPDRAPAGGTPPLLQELSLDLVVACGRKTFCKVNGATLAPGDRAGRFRVLDITRTGVWFEVPGQGRVFLRPGETRTLPVGAP
ncbi:hypothetical protein G3N55_05620 [Dissulfurirhabdus thermomarina]|uniref:Uncharacterized protein n=1 Tax=Dissulfurirhabdus thermomarina TaxID=1765737 RepID=A0A6N9TPF1_DISTH|nr:hypothetical protein [Dissulfurirhabdus thermomarina]NDY42320.1 hypothetical protein [Dissulfurirhabdus thermomarina]NMX22427.1 hypothetical protein [Dissulfurirhabdus thermomarina]